jgi:glycosyltransferase involved in cell wall biosynthesis
MSREPLVAVCFQRLGPYHHARLSAAGARTPLAAIEIFERDATYAWSVVEGARGFRRVTLCPQRSSAPSMAAVWRRLDAALDELRPEVVAVPGWSDTCALRALRWCALSGRRAVLMSDSGRDDRRRRRWSEALKSRIIALYGAALVGGGPHAAYVEALGFPAGAIFEGYDAVDNAHFAEGAATARANAAKLRQELGLPERYFLASTRFVEKKNVARLIDGYELYRRSASGGHWNLVLLGDGPLRSSLVGQICRRDLEEDVVLPGFMQYDALPAYYGLAGAFVHASTTEQWGLVVNEAMASGLPVLVSERCGCAPDLVQDGVNGFSFDPYDVEALAGLMQRVAALADDRRLAMGEAGRRIIADWGPERFADGLMQAVEVARRRPPSRASWLDRSLLWALVHR